MKEVLKYEAIDGSIHDTREEALAKDAEVTCRWRLREIVNKFYYRDLDAEEIVDGLINHAGPKELASLLAALG